MPQDQHNHLLARTMGKLRNILHLKRSPSTFRLLAWQGKSVPQTDAVHGASERQISRPAIPRSPAKPDIEPPIYDTLRRRPSIVEDPNSLASPHQQFTTTSGSSGRALVEEVIYDLFADLGRHEEAVEAAEQKARQVQEELDKAEHTISETLDWLAAANTRVAAHKQIISQLKAQEKRLDSRIHELEGQRVADHEIFSPVQGRTWFRRSSLRARMAELGVRLMLAEEEVRGKGRTIRRLTADLVESREALWEQLHGGRSQRASAGPTGLF